MKALLVIVGVVAVVIAVSNVVGFLRDPAGATRSAAAALQREPEAPPPVAEPKLSLPAERVDAGAVLGKARARVRAALGKPTSTTTAPEQADWFKRGDVDLWVVYASGKAVELGAGPTAGVSDATKAQVFEWLGFARAPATAAPVPVNGASYRLHTTSSAAIATEVRYLSKREEREQADRQRTERRKLADGVQLGFNKEGIEARVQARGSTLWIESMSCGRVALYQLLDVEDVEHAAFRESLRKAGFKDVKCLDPLTDEGVGERL